MIKRLFNIFLAFFFPWLILLLNDNPGGAIIALIMQASVIGWLPATLWALRTMRESRKSQTATQKKPEDLQEKEK